MGIFSKKRDLTDTIFDMKFSRRSLDRAATKAQSAEAAHKNKVRAAIAAGQPEIAQIYAQNAIRCHNECLNYMRMSARIDAVIGQLETQQAMASVTASMRTMTISLDTALKQMDMTQMQEVLGKFESQFEEIGVRGAVASEAMAAATGVSAQQDEVQNLINQIADEQGLAVAGELSAPAMKTPATTVAAPVAKETETDRLAARMAML